MPERYFRTQAGELVEINRPKGDDPGRPDDRDRTGYDRPPTQRPDTVCAVCAQPYRSHDGRQSHYFRAAPNG